ncbi:MAG: sulfatase [Verrucomicrobiae bacterium]
MKFHSLLACVLIVLASTAMAAENTKPPNIVFILADDLGWTDLAVQGSKYYETPNIDRLAAQGTRFMRYYNCQNCAPTRAALISGQYAPRTGVYNVGSIDRFAWRTRTLRPVDNSEELPMDKITIAQSLKAAGYSTAMFGKWGLQNKGPQHPGKRGFDEAITSIGKHFDFDTNPKTPYAPGTYLADFLTDKAEDFIRRHKDGPFFLYLPHFGVHEPFQAKTNLIAHFKPKPPVDGHRSPTYAAMIASVDESVGRLMALLDELKIADNTVVIFSSDNGGVDKITSNLPLRDAKGSLYDGGTRDPFIVRWPGVTKPGTTNDVPAIHVDLYPTLLDIAAAKPPANYPLDGESLVPLFRDNGASLKRDAIYQHFPGYLGPENNPRATPVGVIIAGDWKLMEFFEDHRLELYNLRADIGEKTNLVTKIPDKTKELYAKMLAWREAIKAPMPTPNIPIKTASNPNPDNKKKTYE